MLVLIKHAKSQNKTLYENSGVITKKSYCSLLFFAYFNNLKQKNYKGGFYMNEALSKIQEYFDNQFFLYYRITVHDKDKVIYSNVEIKSKNLSVELKEHIKHLEEDILLFGMDVTNIVENDELNAIYNIQSIMKIQDNLYLTITEPFDRISKTDYLLFRSQKEVLQFYINSENKERVGKA